MKIFALNLSLLFDLWQPDAPYQFFSTSFKALEEELATQPDSARQRYLRLSAPDPERLADRLFALQARSQFRECEVAIHLLFEEEAARDATLKLFVEKFRSMAAAGGLVYNEDRAYLCIYNRGCWTLPKGKVEKGESFAEAAEREVLEETGLKRVSLEEKLGETYHTFKGRKGWVLKTTHWYRMQASKDQPLIPQAEEQIEAVSWLSQAEWLDVAPQSYPLNRELFEAEFTKHLPS